MIKNVVWSNAGIVRKQAELLFSFEGFNFYGLKEDYKNNKFPEWGLCYLEHNNCLFCITNCSVIKSKIEQQPEEYKKYFLDFDNLITNSFEKSLSNAKDKKCCDISKGVAQYLNREQEAEKVKQEYITWLNNKQKEDKIERERIKKEKEQKEQKQYEQELIQAEEKFIKHEFIPGHLFVGLCDKYEIALPLRTLGWCLKNLIKISQNQYSHNSKNGSSVIFNYVKELNKKLVS